MPLRLSRREFHKLVAEAMGELPAPVQEVMENVAVFVEPWPSREQLESTGTPNRYGLLGLYEGIPLIDRDYYNMVLPDRISLFHHPLEAVCSSVEELAEEVRATIIHEIAHHVGWSDEDLERIEGR